MNQNQSMPTPLPVIGIISAAFQFVWDKKARLIRALCIPVVAIALLEYVSSFPDSAEMGWFYFLIKSVVYVLFAITCHRLVLIGDSGVPEYGNLRWKKRESYFLGWFLVIGIISMLFSFVINSVIVSTVLSDVKPEEMAESYQSLQSYTYLVYIPILYLLSRLSVLYPAIALDQPLNMKWAWKFTEGNGWRLTLIVSLLPWTLYFLAGLFYKEEPSIAGIVFLKLAGFILLAVEVVALSFAYKHLMANQEWAALAGEPPHRNKLIDFNSVLIERIYLGASLPLLIVYPVFRGGGFRHGAEVIVVLFGLVWFCMAITGFILALKAASERPTMFVVLTLVALLTTVSPYWF